MTKQNNQYVIGVDGGGTKTIAALADVSGRILRIGRSGSASPRNVGIEKAAENVAKALKMIMPKNKVEISSVFVGLPSVQEEFSPKTGEIKKIILQEVKGKLIIGSDQLVAFRSGTDKKDGIILIAGTGCVAHGWRGKKEHKSSGWGWLADEGSAFWIGQKVYQAVLKELDKRGQKTLLTRLVFQRFKIKNKEDLLILVYSAEATKVLPQLSVLCDRAAAQGDNAARSIMGQAGRELAISTSAVIKKLSFRNRKFPLVLVGGVLKSKIILNTIKKEIKKIAPKAEFIMPKKVPVFGAVKLAIEHAPAG